MNLLAIANFLAYHYGSYSRGLIGYYHFDWTYILVLIGFVFSTICSSKVSSTYRKYDKVRTNSNKTGAQVAEEILRANGIYDVQVNHIPGNLTGHYNPQTNVVNLSDSTYASTSVAAAGVAAHEIGHVIQHHTGYVPIKIRNTIVPLANIGTYASYIFIVLGLLFRGNSSQLFLNIGIYAFLGVVLFQLVTLPVEIDASSRALRTLRDRGILGEVETKQARKVLTAAAMTYVAALATALLQFIRLLLLFSNRRD